MRCNICNEVLTPDEIKYEEKYRAFAPCRVCIDAACVPFKFPLKDETLEEGFDDCFIATFDIDRGYLLVDFTGR